MSSDSLCLSIVVPVRNEEEVLLDTYGTLNRILGELEMRYEVLVVDNGSTDQTPVLMSEICDEDARWKFIRLSRNFGYENSITAGMLAARGDAIMVIDADLQDPPELIPEFVAKWREGYDIVYGVRKHRRGEPFWRVLPTRLALRFISWLSDDVAFPVNSGDFRLITRRVRDAFAQMPEANRYVRGMIHWLGFRQIGIPYSRRGRAKGRSKVSWRYLFALTLNAIFNFSVQPLRFFSLFGLGVLGLSGLLTVLYVVLLFLSDVPDGLSPILLLLLINLGVTSLGIGVVGEYVARAHAQSKCRPLWLVDYTLNLSKPPLARWIEQVNKAYEFPEGHALPTLQDAEV